jgi:hypothetical protein
MNNEKKIDSIINESLKNIIRESTNKLDLDELYTQLNELRANLSRNTYLKHENSFIDILSLIHKMMNADNGRIHFNNNDFK